MIGEQTELRRKRASSKKAECVTLRVRTLGGSRQVPDRWGAGFSLLPSPLQQRGWWVHSWQRTLEKICHVASSEPQALPAKELSLVSEVSPTVAMDLII